MKPIKPLKDDSMKRLEDVNPRFVLDLGCGKCRVSKRFIDSGAKVVGVDRNPVVKSFDNFEFVQENILDFKFEPKYDLIIASMVLHYLSVEDGRRLIRRMQENTVSGGFHFVICMSDKEREFIEKRTGEEWGNRLMDYSYLSVSELKELYSDWEIVKNVNCISWVHGEPPHQHRLVLFLARKK